MSTPAPHVAAAAKSASQTAESIHKTTTVTHKPSPLPEEDDLRRRKTSLNIKDNSSGNQPPLIFSERKRPKQEVAQKEENKEALQEFEEIGSLENFRDQPSASYTLKKLGVKNGINNIYLHKFTADNSHNTQSAPSISYSIRVELDHQHPQINNIVSHYEHMTILISQSPCQIFTLDEEYEQYVMEARGLRHDQLIVVLGKLMIPDEITQKMANVVRTFSSLYDLSQRSHSSGASVPLSQTATQPLPEAESTEQTQPLEPKVRTRSSTRPSG